MTRKHIALPLLVVCCLALGGMPHNLYLHSALVQSRKFQKDEASIRAAVKFNTIDSTVALTLAFFVNAAILILAAIVFFGKESMFFVKKTNFSSC